MTLTSKATKSTITVDVDPQDATQIIEPSGGAWTLLDGEWTEITADEVQEVKTLVLSPQPHFVGE